MVQEIYPMMSVWTFRTRTHLPVLASHSRSVCAATIPQYRRITHGAWRPKKHVRVSSNVHRPCLLMPTPPTGVRSSAGWSLAHTHRYSGKRTHISPSYLHTIIISTSLTYMRFWSSFRHSCHSPLCVHTCQQAHPIT